MRLTITPLRRDVLVNALIGEIGLLSGLLQRSPSAGDAADDIARYQLELDEAQRLLDKIGHTPTRNFYEFAPVHYQSLYTCPAGDDVITDEARAFMGPDGRRYHSRDCADQAAMMEDAK